MMRIKRIRAADMPTARDKVRELGPNAVIISVRKLESAEARDGSAGGGVEIIAGIDERDQAAPRRSPATTPATSSVAAAAVRQAPAAAPATAVAAPAAAAVAQAAAYGRASAMHADAGASRSAAVRTLASGGVQRETATVGAAAGRTEQPRSRGRNPVRPLSMSTAQPLDLEALRRRARPPSERFQLPISEPPATPLPPVRPQEPATAIAERAYELLRAIGLSDEIAENALEQAVRAMRADSLDDLSLLIESALTQLVLNLPEGPRLSPVQLAGKTVFFVGAAGAGKTTSLLKAAIRLQREGAAVAVVSADASRLGCREQLEGYCHLLDLKFLSAYTPDEMQAVVASLTTRTVVLVDTPPLTARSEAGPGGDDADLSWDPARDGLGPLVAAIEHRCVVLVTAATGSEREMHRVAAAAWRLGASTVVLTHLDEAAAVGGWLAGAGAALNCLAQLRLAPLFLATGRDVLTDCEALDAYELVIAALESAAGAAPARAQR